MNTRELRIVDEHWTAVAKSEIRSWSNQLTAHKLLITVFWRESRLSRQTQEINDEKVLIKDGNIEEHSSGVDERFRSELVSPQVAHKTLQNNFYLPCRHKK